LIGAETGRLKEPDRPRNGVGESCGLKTCQTAWAMKAGCFKAELQKLQMASFKNRKTDS